MADQLAETRELLDQVQALLPQFEGRPEANQLVQVANQLRYDIAHIQQMGADMAAPKARGA